MVWWELLVGLGQFGWEFWLSGSLVWQKIFWIRWEPFGLGGSFGLVGAFRLVGSFGLFRLGGSFGLFRLGGSFTRSLVGVLELVT